MHTLPMLFAFTDNWDAVLSLFRKDDLTQTRVWNPVWSLILWWTKKPLSWNFTVGSQLLHLCRRSWQVFPILIRCPTLVAKMYLPHNILFGNNRTVACAGQHEYMQRRSLTPPLQQNVGRAKVYSNMGADRQATQCGNIQQVRPQCSGAQYQHRTHAVRRGGPRHYKFSTESPNWPP